MATIRRFEDSSAWRGAIALAAAAFKLTEAPSFRFKGDLVNQIRRAALSVSNNIAEGFERGSTAELISFLYIARGSCGEVRSMMRFALELGEMPGEEERIAALAAECERVSRQIYNWLEALKNGEISGQRRLDDRARAAYEAGKRRDGFERWRADYNAELERQMREDVYGRPDAPPLPDLLDYAQPREGGDAGGAAESVDAREVGADGRSGKARDGAENAGGGTPECPVCGRAMVKRKSRSGSEFWGCSAYPQCKGSRNV